MQFGPRRRAPSGVRILGRQLGDDVVFVVEHLGPISGFGNRFAVGAAAWQGHQTR
jgi:hypothetical protein